MILMIECIILIILFTVAVLAASKDPLDTIYDMPEPIIQRCIELGLIDETKTATSKETKIKKLFAAIFIALLFALFLYFINNARTFKDGFTISYIFWLVIDWYDCFVLDWGYVCHSKKFIIPGTEDLIDSYKDYKFHFLGSVKGMLIGLPVCVIVGILVQIASILFS